MKLPKILEALAWVLLILAAVTTTIGIWQPDGLHPGVQWAFTGFILLVMAALVIAAAEDKEKKR